jgi:hypothetical protein
MSDAVNTVRSAPVATRSADVAQSGVDPGTAHLRIGAHESHARLDPLFQAHGRGFLTRDPGERGDRRYGRQPRLRLNLRHRVARAHQVRRLGRQPAGGELGEQRHRMLGPDEAMAKRGRKPAQ